MSSSLRPIELIFCHESPLFIKIPFVVDNPLMRLDVGHDKRLIEQLGKSEDQIIMNLILQIIL